ncbi:hypothetical protein [Curtobacterium sp. MCSS17_008]|uniref:hypothetical protein n=1 Tax=Curtobacterium sp. MCSS17_008 TaxID=2175647 RepID=UPI0011B5CF66|nr:hypothetical protein [Curtobacterium sp. MCSS17_008]
MSVRVRLGLVDLAPCDARGHGMGRQIDVRQTDLHEVREGGERPQVFVFESTPQQQLSDTERVTEFLSVHGWIAADHQRMVTVRKLDRSFDLAPEHGRKSSVVHG